MRVNVYAEEMTDRIEIISKTIDGNEFTGLRIYLELPVTMGGHGQHRVVEGPEVHTSVTGHATQVVGPFLHRPGDDDSSAVTFWGKRDLRTTLRKALEELDRHYESRELKIGHRVEPTKPIEYESGTIPVGTVGHVQDIRGSKINVQWTNHFGIVGWCDLDCVRRI